MSATVRRRGRHLLASPEADLAVRVLGPDGPPALTLRLPGEVTRPGLTDGRPAPSHRIEPATHLVDRHPGDWWVDPDPLAGNELWRAVTPTTVLAGLRDTATAAQLLEVLDFGRLNGLRFRMSTARPSAGRRDGRTGSGRTFGTVCAVSTLLCWPGHARADLTAGAGRAASSALQRTRVAQHPDAALALRWVVALTAAFPGDPMTLAPLLLRLRWFDAGQEFLLPARWPSALLSGDAVAVSGSGSVEVTAGLGSADPDPVGFVTGLESRAGEPDPLPPDEALHRAVDLVRTLAQARQGSHQPGRRSGPGSSR